MARLDLLRNGSFYGSRGFHDDAEAVCEQQRVDISAASPAHPDTPFALMSTAPANLPVESWEPAF